MRYTPTQLGAEIRNTRKSIGVTQAQLALTAGTGLRFIIDLERGKPTCEIGKVLAVLNTLGIDVTLTPPAIEAASPVLPQRGAAVMARSLDVYLHEKFVGVLIQDDHGDIDFGYAQDWLSDPNALALSVSLPLRSERYGRQECKAFFGGLLPESGAREAVARSLGISAKNDFAMLERIGGECAGAVTLLPSGSSPPGRSDDARSLTDQELAQILRTLPRRPLMAGEAGVRLSLAGAQDKIAVRIVDGRVSLPLDGAPSTHIIKPAIDRYAGVVFNEAFCMTLARAVGLPVAPVAIDRADKIAYLSVERYDRVVTEAGHIERLHQEDFCQSLGVASEHKYQNEGGPSLQQCFQLVRDVSSLPIVDLSSLLNGVVFSFLIGNNDAHGKNFSLLDRRASRQGVTTRLAPFYDLLCTAYYPELSDKTAMKIGGEYESERIFTKHWEKFAADAGLGKPLVKRRVRELAGLTISNLSAVKTTRLVEADIAALIQSRCERTLRRVKA